jgi:hypothetical protein
MSVRRLGMNPAKGEKQMAKAKKAMRTYKVVDAIEAKELGAKVFSENAFNRFALVAVRGTLLDNVICWAYNRDALDKKAEARNKDIAMLGKMMGKATEMLDASDENESD